MRGRRWRRSVTDLLTWAAVVPLLAFELFPIYWIVQMAFKHDVQIYAMPPEFVFRPTLDNFTYILGRTQPYLGNLKNSILVALGTTALCAVVGTPAAYALSRTVFRSKQVVMFSILASRMLPPVAIAIPLFLIMRSLGLVNTYAGVILAHSTFILPLVVWVMKTFFDEVPVELDEAARIDGASAPLVFARVALPLAGPGLGAAATLAVIFSWNEFFFSLILTGAATRTMPVALAAFVGAITLEWGRMAAAATLAIAPILLFTFLAQRILIRGLTGGAVKG
jgi:multiple sugar transport system permease protein